MDAHRRAPTALHVNSGAGCRLGFGVASSGWVELGRLVKRERNRRHLDQVTFALEIGLKSRTLISEIERGVRDNYDIETITLIEIALGWRSGSVERVVSGRKPLVEVDPIMAEFRVYWERLSADRKAALLRFVKSFMGS